MSQSRPANGETHRTEILAGLSRVTGVRSAFLLEPSGRMLERVGAGGGEGEDGVRQITTLTAALHSAATHLGRAMGAGPVSRILLPGEASSILILPVHTRSVPLVLLLVVEGEADEALEEELSRFLDAMSEERHEPSSDTRDLEASLLEGLERLFPRTDDRGE